MEQLSVLRYGWDGMLLVFWFLSPGMVLQEYLFLEYSREVLPKGGGVVPWDISENPF